MTAAPTQDISEKIAGLSELTIFELRTEWRRHHRMPLPMRLSRDLLIRGIAYKMQEQAFGGLSKTMRRRLATPHQSAEDGGSVRVPSIVLKPGTRLIREWHGETCSVLVQKDGFQWRGTTYRSLTTIAKEITGAHWSGPRFFGLTKPSGGAGHVEA